MARQIERSFNACLAEAGGSGPMWTILIALKSGGGHNQNELAASIGIRGATLSHHLNAMDEKHLITRRRDPDNRRVHIVELTAEGEQMFHTLRAAVTSFDRRLRRGVTAGDREAFEATLDTLVGNARAAERAASRLDAS